MCPEEQEWGEKTIGDLVELQQGLRTCSYWTTDIETAAEKMTIEQGRVMLGIRSRRQLMVRERGRGRSINERKNDSKRLWWTQLSEAGGGCSVCAEPPLFIDVRRKCWLEECKSVRWRFPVSRVRQSQCSFSVTTVTLPFCKEQKQLVIRVGIRFRTVWANLVTDVWR